MLNIKSKPDFAISGHILVFMLTALFIDTGIGHNTDSSYYIAG